MNIPEFAMIGRSNVGKSSLINMLAGGRKIAKISGTPGKTRTINHFIVRSLPGGTSSGIKDTPSPEQSKSKIQKWFLVDLPGYGYARLSKTDRSNLQRMIQAYLINSKSMKCAFLLIDSRLIPQTNDLQFISWLKANQIPFIILFTKTDKLSTGQWINHIHKYRRTISADYEELPDFIATSTVTSRGIAEILGVIEKMLCTQR